MISEKEINRCINEIHHNKSVLIEHVFSKRFPNLYLDTDFQLLKSRCDGFKFSQILYHYINNDMDLLLGRCKICGNLCSFKNFFIGYNTYCSNKCSKNDVIIKQKIKQTKLDRYGSETYNNINKMQETCIERYGCKNPFQNNDVKKKISDVCKERYGTSRYTQSRDYKEKTKSMCIEKYGVDSFSKTSTFKDLFCDDEFESARQDKIKQTCIDRYNESSYSQTDEFKIKSYNTKKKNHSLNTSKIEDQLVKYFEENSVNYIHQYRSRLYPFNCDFYFPDYDLYVEIQGSWTHGGHPFTGSEEDMNIFDQWSYVNSAYYRRAIETWTIRDVKKRETAKKNNLNYLEIFSCDFEICKNILEQYI